MKQIPAAEINTRRCKL